MAARGLMIQMPALARPLPSTTSDLRACSNLSYALSADGVLPPFVFFFLFDELFNLFLLFVHFGLFAFQCLQITSLFTVGAFCVVDIVYSSASFAWMNTSVTHFRTRSSVSPHQCLLHLGISVASAHLYHGRSLQTCVEFSKLGVLFLRSFF
ncbi:hypothetical protein EDC04DRAFT_485146 [Pisolithus marmoratus]|nr:hypothetical protein EDC04DRAFT_485146 [Pisolithus marmoratus]